MSNQEFAFTSIPDDPTLVSFEEFAHSNEDTLEILKALSPKDLLTLSRSLVSLIVIIVALFAPDSLFAQSQIPTGGAYRDNLGRIHVPYCDNPSDPNMTVNSCYADLYDQLKDQGLSVESLVPNNVTIPAGEGQLVQRATPTESRPNEYVVQAANNTNQGYESTGQNIKDIWNLIGLTAGSIVVLGLIVWGIDAARHRSNNC